jgi:hypothetical protein
MYRKRFDNLGKVTGCKPIKPNNRKTLIKTNEEDRSNNGIRIFNIYIGQSEVVN